MDQLGDGRLAAAAGQQACQDGQAWEVPGGAALAQDRVGGPGFDPSDEAEEQQHQVCKSPAVMGHVKRLEARSLDGETLPQVDRGCADRGQIDVHRESRNGPGTIVGDGQVGPGHRLGTRAARGGRGTGARGASCWGARGHHSGREGHLIIPVRAVQGGGKLGRAGPSRWAGGHAGCSSRDRWSDGGDSARGRGQQQRRKALLIQGAARGAGVGQVRAGGKVVLVREKEGSGRRGSLTG